MISIIVPVYNAEKTIKRCIESIINQTYKDFELIIVDDGSTDSSVNICSKYISSNVKFYKNENHGAAYTRTYGLQRAKGEYITFCDADDYYTNDHLEKMINAAMEEAADITICGYFTSDSNGNHRCCEETSAYISKEDTIKSMMLNNNIGGFCWNKMFKKSVVANSIFPSDLTHCEDTYFYFSALEKAENIYYLAEPLSYYCDNDDSATRDISKIISPDNRSQYTIAFEKILNDFNLAEPVRTYTKIMIFKTALATKKMYKHNHENNQKFLNNLNNDIRSNMLCYLRSNSFTLKNKVRSMITVVTGV